MNNVIKLEWNTTNTVYGDGFELETKADLSASNWIAVEDIDLWPSAATNWETSLNISKAYFRVLNVDRGHLVNASHIMTMTPEEVASALGGFGISSSLVNYPISMYSVRYETFDLRGESSLAAGLLILPATIQGSGFPLPPERVALLSFQHGTLFADSAAPSAFTHISQLDGEILFGLIFATDGYAVSMPDYLGIGPGSEGLHPYLHARSEAVASVDMLRATRSFLENSDQCKPNGQLFIAGYSQGGHATLALQRELQLNHAQEFPLTASAPMAGPQDLSGTMKARARAGAANGSSAYTAYVILGLNTIYRYGTYSNFFRPDYATLLQDLFDGTHTGSEINALLPADPIAMLTDSFVSNLTENADDPFSAALLKNDTYRNWTPTTPTRFYHCAADDIVPYSNSVVAVNAFLNAGASTNLVQLIDPQPTASHTAGFLPCMLATKSWFNTLRDK
ncbi:MAG: hypothetical protein JXR25_00825 [Pontiellaceae bacterium]|nr:hypothetical protein [Pontiellaceae bacterium]MBN2783342.1 hypothetical protein [Pontiellaceae bacterium]